MENCNLIVGLGNPGAEYAGTRHNVGFLVVDRLAERWQARWSFEARFDARLARAQRQRRQLFLCMPQTFMNSSGSAVRRAMDFFGIPPDQILVLVDDADLPLGELRLRPRGSSGGHHGLESVETHLGTRDYARLRVGIGRKVDGAREITGHVLGRFGAAEKSLLGKVLERAADQAECWVGEGIAKAMNEFNGTVEIPENKKD